MMLMLMGSVVPYNGGADMVPHSMGERLVVRHGFYSDYWLQGDDQGDPSLYSDCQDSIIFDLCPAIARNAGHDLCKI
jgi:hypothetical protein